MAAPATIQVFNILRDSTGAGLANVRVTCTLTTNNATVLATGDSIVEVQQSTTTDSTGKYTFTIVANDLLSPANTVYEILEPHRSYQIAPQSANGSPQQSTAANVIVTTPTPLAPATSNITGNLTIAGTLSVTGLVTAQAGLTISGGTLTIPAGGFTMAGPLTLTAAASQIIPGATSFSVRDTGNANDNLLVSNAGNVTVRGSLTVTAGPLTVTAGGVTVTAGNLTVSAGNVILSGNVNIGGNVLDVTGGTTLRLNFTGYASGVQIANGPLVVLTGGLTVTAGDLTVTAGRVVIAAAVSKIVPGATSLSLRNNADNADNVLVTNLGLVTLRNGLLAPPSAGGTVAGGPGYTSVPIKAAETVLGAGAASVAITSIPANGRHLVIEWLARGDTVATNTSFSLRINNQSATYDHEGLSVTGTGAVSGLEGLNTASITAGNIPASTAPANYFGVGEWKIKHYANATAQKSYMIENTNQWADTTGNQLYQRYSGKWRTTGTAMNEADFLPGAGNIITGSAFAVRMDP